MRPCLCFASLLLLTHCGVRDEVLGPTTEAADSVSAAMSQPAGLAVSIFHRGNDQSQASPPDANGLLNQVAFLRSATPAYTFLCTACATGLPQLSGGDATPTNQYLMNLATGAAVTDATRLQTTVFDVRGYAFFPTTEDYVVSLAGDDAAAVYVDGSTVPGTGSQLVWTNYAQSKPSTATAHMTAGWHAFELVYYNQMYGSNWGGARLSFGFSGPAAVSYAPTPLSAPGAGQGAVTAGASWAPTPPAYNASLPAWPQLYSDAQKSAQRAAAVTLQASIQQALRNKATSFTIAPGVYRTTQYIEVANSNDFTLYAANVEIISERDIHLGLFNNSNVTVRGPISFDADPVGVSQGVIVGTDQQTYVDLQLMSGYPAPTVGHRVMFFTPQGLMLPHYQDTVTKVASLGSGVYRLTMSSLTFQYYRTQALLNTAIGNYMALENPENASGGINMVGNNGVHMTDVNFYSYGLTGGGGELGLDKFERYWGTRRPGTNRLTAGGYFNFFYNGGSFSLTDAEVSYNFDDLMDNGSAMGFAFAQANTTQMYVAQGQSGDVCPKLGQTLHFYNTETLEEDGIATAIAAQPATNPQVAAQFADLVTQYGQLNKASAFLLVTLDRPVTISPLDFVDCEQSRPKSMTVKRAYLHDSLACGICVKGAQSIQLTDNFVERTGVSGIDATYETYWWEGGIPGNIVISNNTVRTTPYNLPQSSASIGVYPDSTSAASTGTPLHNVTIAANLVQNPKSAGIEVANAQNVLISGNTVDNPTSSLWDWSWNYAKPWPKASAIWLHNVAANTRVTNNTALNTNTTVNAEVVRLSPSTLAGHVLLSANASTSPSGQQVDVPNAAFTKINDSSNDARIVYSGGWNFNYDNTAFAGDNHAATTAGASVTFSFTGSRARWFSIVGQGAGLAKTLVDGKVVSTVDPSTLYHGGWVGDVVAFDTGTLQPGGHTLQIVCLRQAGSQGSSTVFLDAFDYY